MDTVYIKMCDCEEIQEHTPDIGDFYWERHIDETERVWVVFDTGFNDYKKLDWGTVWLPRQEDLQAMVRPNWKKLPYMLTMAFNGAINGGSCSYVWDNGKHFTSMEQLWLAYVMHELHSKRWDGTKWVNS